MAYTPLDAQDNMMRLIAGMEARSEELKALTPSLDQPELGQVETQILKLIQDIFICKAQANFNAASATFIREPTPAEVKSLQATLQLIGRSISQIAKVSAVITFVENVMTANAQRFGEIVQTFRQ